MKKKLKIGLSVLLALVLCAAGYILYIVKFKQYDVADEEVTEIVKEQYTIELPDGTIITLDDDGEVAEDTSGEVTDGEQAAETDDATEDVEGTATVTTGTTAPSKGTGTTSGSTGTSTGKDNKPATKPESSGSTEAGKPAQKPTVAAIKDKYRPAFQALEAQAESKLNALVGRAKVEYIGKKENGEKIDYGYFYNKYTSAAAELEGRTDSVFNGVLKAVQKDLEKNGYDKSYAQSFLDEYNASKKSRKESLMNKVIGL
ncbi:hypothetical protein [Sporosarcina sp. ITBMC105]